MTTPVSNADMRAALHTAIEKAGGVRAYARAVRLSPTYVSRCASGVEPVRGRLAEALGFVRKIEWRRATDPDPVDWRARALAAEAERDELRGALRTIERRLRVDAAPLVPLVNAHGGPREREAWRAVYSSAIHAQGWVGSTCGATITTRHGDHAQHVCALPAGHDGEHQADGTR